MFPQHPAGVLFYRVTFLKWVFSRGFQGAIFDFFLQFLLYCLDWGDSINC